MRDKEIRVGEKSHGVYMHAVTLALEQHNQAILLSRGRLNSKAIDILENIKRQHSPLVINMSTATVQNGDKRTSELQVIIKRD